MSKLTSKLAVKGMLLKARLIGALKNERGDTNIIAIILILAIVIALALLFKDKIFDLFDKIWGKVEEPVDSMVL